MVRAIQVAGAVLSVLLLGASNASARQVSVPREGRSAVIVFTGAGTIRPDDAFTYWVGPTFRLGGGAEHRFANGLTLLGELEWLHRPKSSGDKDALFPSLNVGYSFERRRLSPFATGGYTVGSSAAFNIGGGVDWRVANRAAVRLEFRTHFLIFDPTLKSYGVRVGLVFG